MIAARQLDVKVVYFGGRLSHRVRLFMDYLVLWYDSTERGGNSRTDAFELYAPQPAAVWIAAWGPLQSLDACPNTAP